MFDVFDVFDVRNCTMYFDVLRCTSMYVIENREMIY